jgi:hypothetical protein
MAKIYFQNEKIKIPPLQPPSTPIIFSGEPHAVIDEGWS